MAEEKVVVGDIDGTFIEKGDRDSSPQELKEGIREMRKRGNLLSLASGRDYVDQHGIWRRLTGEEKLLPMEAILYEDACIKLGDGRTYTFGGLNKQQLELVAQIEHDRPELFAGLVPLPGSNFTVRTARVTREFADGIGTNVAVLVDRHTKIVAYVDELRADQRYSALLSNIHVGKSADGIDFLDKGAHKGVAFGKYIEVLNEIGITGDKIIVLGDAANDEGMLKKVLEAGGIAGYVGMVGQTDSNKGDLERTLREFAQNAPGRLIIPKVRGPIGAAYIIHEYVLD
ncbi:HAD hydrolase family protein [Candidatus Pacearchaeota archaeon]|nr:HAD hydrolase family protein [Candidatus Pacearchaeota archaeon]